MSVVTPKMTLLSALISPCGKYRYWWSRSLGMQLHDGKPCIFIMLNPSTADDKQDDATTRRCKDFAAGLGYDQIGVVNLFALRATNPGELYAAADPVGPENDEAIMEAAYYADAVGGIVICGWGNHGKHKARDEAVLTMLEGIELHCLKQNEDGTPTHPLYLSRDLKPMLYKRSVE